MQPVKSQPLLLKYVHCNNHSSLERKFKAKRRIIVTILCKKCGEMYVIKVVQGSTKIVLYF
jgi:transcription elongation factor Elf1